MFKRFAAVAAVAIGLAWGGLAAAQGAPHIVRGAVASVSATQLVVTGKDGKTTTVALAPNWGVAVLQPISIDKIQPGSFIGTAEMPQADGTGVSLEVHVFPPGMKMGAGHYPWDSQAGAMMTNGDVGAVESVANGRKLTVTYPGGTRTIVVPANVPIVLITPTADHSVIAPGAYVFLVAQAGADGTLTANAVTTGANGAAPPM